MLVRSSILGLALLAACRPEDASVTSTTAAIVPASRHPAIDPPLPKLEFGGGRVLHRPHIVTVTFEGDAAESVRRFEAFGSAITTGRWWKAATDGLCAGGCIEPGTASSVRLSPAAIGKIAVEQLGGLLVSAIAKGELAQPTDDTAYLLYLPAGATFSGGLSCAFGGARARHASFLYAGVVHPYAAVLRCGDDDETMASAAHEVLEMTTDPVETGFRLDASSPFALFGPKAVDPCTLVTLDNHRVLADGHVFHRAWSNAAAASGHDPCVPSPGGAYFGAVPRVPRIRLRAGHAPITVEWTAFADRAVPDWTVSLVEIGRLIDGRRCLDLRLRTHEVNNGATFRADVELVDPHCPHALAAGLVSTLGARSHVWPLDIQQDNGAP